MKKAQQNYLAGFMQSSLMNLITHFAQWSDHQWHVKMPLSRNQFMITTIIHKTKKMQIFCLAIQKQQVNEQQGDISRELKKRVQLSVTWTSWFHFSWQYMCACKHDAARVLLPDSYCWDWRWGIQPIHGCMAQSGLQPLPLAEGCHLRRSRTWLCGALQRGHHICWLFL